MSNWAVRSFELGDEQSLNDLYNVVFGGSRSLDEWRWKFLGSSSASGFPSAPIIVGVDNHQKIVGCYCSILHKVKYFGSDSLIVQAVDNAILESFRGQGMQRAMFTMWKGEAAKKGLPIYFGFTVSTALDQGIKGLGYQDQGELPVLCHAIDKASMLAVCFRPFRKIAEKLRKHGIAWPDLKQLQVSRLYRFDSSVDRLFDKINAPYPIITIRNADYLNWRFIDKTRKTFTVFKLESKSELLGYIVLKIRHEKEKTGYIFDLIAEPKIELVQILVRAAMLFLQDNGAVAVKCFMPEYTYYYQCLTELGFVKENWKPFGFIAGLTDEENQHNEFFNKKNWFITLADTDL